MSRPDVCVIFNARAGRGGAAQRLRHLQRVLGPRAEFRATQKPGHATDLAREAAQKGFPYIGAAGGDGTVHQVATGLLQAGRPEATLAVFPIGSANDYAHSLELDGRWWLREGNTVEAAALDVGLVQAPDGRHRYFVNTIGIGFTGSVALDAEHVPLRGLGRDLIALLHTLCVRYRCPQMTASFDGTTFCEPTLIVSLGIGRRQGNFVVAPDALLDDGLFDYLHAGALSRWQLLRLLPAAVQGRPPTDEPQVRLGVCRRSTVDSEAALVAHIDGEIFCRPHENIHRLEVEILPGRLRVLRARSVRRGA